MSRSFAIVVVAIALLVGDTNATRPLPEYRYFRALSIDLQGRPPTRAEIAAFEQPGFALDAWLDDKLQGPRYAERLRRIYTDLLRLELPEGAAVFRPPSILLRWTQVTDPDGKPVDLYFREQQRRAKPEIDGQLCFTQDESGVQVGPDGPPVGSPRRLDRKLFEARTVVVKPWWLYADYKAAKPRDRASPDWVQRFGYELQWSMFNEPDGKTPMTGVRVCREEAQTAEQGRIYVSGRTVTKGDPLLPGRQTRLPADTKYALANRGIPVACVSPAGYQSSLECGCGVGLERCLPTGPNGFVMPWTTPLGVDRAFDSAPRPAILWLRTWWSEEATRFIDEVFEHDRDVRELVTSPSTMVNGPLAQFYRFFANATCCGDGIHHGYNEAEPLFDPSAAPKTLQPHEVATWTVVENRGRHAAGILTMPIFLLKYGSRRQRAHAIYNTFMCKEFVAETVKLQPSTEPDLMKRPGCASCHRRLEPMAAYFSRITESDWTYLPPAKFPVSNERCTAHDPKSRMPGGCVFFYDPAFTDVHRSLLRGAYAAPAHADAGPRGFGDAVAESPEFAPCVVRNVAQSLLGRALTAEDDAWKASLTKTFVDGEYRMRPLVRAIVTSARYRDVNDHKPVSR